MRLLSLVTCAAALLAANCRPAGQASQAAPPHPRAKALEQAWRRSQEEEQGAVQVYRPAAYPFPPARGREGLTFAAGGRLTQLAIAPTDGALPLPGRWRWESARVLHLSVPGQPPQDYRLEVLELTPDILKVRPAEAR